MQLEANITQILLSQASDFAVEATQLRDLLQAAFRRAFAQSFQLPEETLTVCINENVVSVKHNDTDITPLKPDRHLVTAVRRLVLQGLQEIRANELYNQLVVHQGQLVEAVVLSRQSNRWVTLRIEGQGEEMRQLRTQLPVFEQLPTETYNPGQRLRVFLMKLESFNADGFLPTNSWRWLVSRAHPGLVRELFQLYLPEAEVQDVVREAGVLSKVAVKKIVSNQQLESILLELPAQERLNLVQWSVVPEVYLANALKTARVKPNNVLLLDEGVAEIAVAPDQMGKAYGRGCLNLKLAEELTGWKIELFEEGEYLYA